MKEILFLDCDGTIREPASGAKFITSFTDQKIIAGAARAIDSYPQDWLITGITNQGGVAAGHKSLDDCIKEQQYTLSLLPRMHSIFFCPDYEGNSCYRVDQFGIIREYFRDYAVVDYSSFRKPGAGMLELGMDLMDTDAHHCLMIGDRDEDKAAAEAANIPFGWAEDWWISVITPTYLIDPSNPSNQSFN